MIDISARMPNTTHRPLVRWAIGSAVVALSAWFGAAGLAFGFLDYPDRLAHRLPFESPVFGGIALAIVVAAPFTAVAALAWRGDARARWSGGVSGVLLVGWIVVQLLVVRELNVLHPVCAAAGAAFAYAGRDAMRDAWHDAR